jgi:hypothetical protein
MNPENQSAVILRQLLKDPVYRIFLALLVVLHVPFFFPGHFVEDLENYSWYLSTVVFLPFLAVVL